MCIRDRLYDDKATVIKNLILFNDGVEKKLYSDRENFADIYPFIPYQFNLLGSVLTSIRTHGASGKHLAEGERSMLALFKESAVTVSYTHLNVPVVLFYPGNYDGQELVLFGEIKDDNYYRAFKLVD